MHDSLCLDDLRRPGPTFLARRLDRTSLCRILADESWTRGLWLQLLGHFEEALAPLEHARSEREGALERATLAMHLLPSHLALGRAREAVACAAEARAAFERTPRRAALAYAGAMGALAAQELGDLEAARLGFERALGVYAATGLSRETAIVSGYLGELALERGEPGVARAWIGRGLGIARTVGDGGLLAWMTTALAASAHELEEAMTHLLEAAGSIDEGGRDLGALVELRYGHVDLLKAAGADPRELAAYLERAQRRVDEASAHAHRVELRCAARILGRSIDALRCTQGRGLRLAGDLSWIATPAGDRVDLARRSVLRRVLQVLVSARRCAPGVGTGVHEIFATAWGGEKASPDAAANRVYVAVARLRKLGLDGCLITGDDGFLLDPRVPVMQER